MGRHLGDFGGGWRQPTRSAGLPLREGGVRGPAFPFRGRVPAGNGRRVATGSPCIARTIAPGSKREFEEHFGWLLLVPDLQSFPDVLGAHGKLTTCAWIELTTRRSGAAGWQAIERGVSILAAGA